MSFPEGVGNWVDRWARSSFNKLRPWLTGVYLVAVASAAYLATRGHLSEISAQIAAVSLPQCAAALLFSLSGLTMSMLAWRVVICAMGARLSLAAASHMFFLSQLGKYLPGSVWPAAMQVEAGRTYGIPRSTNFASYLLALLLSLATGAVVAGLALGLSLSSQWFVLTLFSLPSLGLLIAAPSLWPRAMASAPTWLAAVVPAALPSRRELGAATALFAGSWVFQGLQLAVLASAAGIEDDQLPLISIGAACVAMAGGLLIIIAPAGLAVREALMVSLLGTGSVAPVAATVMLSRVVLTAADLLAGAIGTTVAATSFHRRRSSRSPMTNRRRSRSADARAGLDHDADVAQ